MNLQESPKPKKTDITIWIIVAIVVVLICCVLAAAALGGTYYYLEKSGKLTTLISGTPIPPAPGQKSPTVTFAPSNGPLVVEPFDPSSSNYPSLADLVPNWTEATQPRTQNWSLTVPSSQPVLLLLGWCTTTTTILQENDQHITWNLTVDYQPIDVKRLYVWNSQTSNLICKTSVGLIRHWTGTQHTIIMTMTVKQKINDGLNDYPSGDYTDVYNVTVNP